MVDVARERAEEFYAVEFPRLVAGLSLYVGDRDLAEELAQEAMLRAFRRWDRVSCLDSPGGWTWRVAINLANSVFRRRRVERRVRRRMQPDGQHLDAEVDAATTVAVRRAVAALPAAPRTAVILRYFLDLTVADTATQMGRTPDAVRSLTKRAAARLRTELGEPEPSMTVEEVDDA